MTHDEQVRQIHLLLARIRAGTTVDAGGVRLNPVSCYTDPARHALEWQTFFRSHPQIIGLSGDLPGPGSFMTIDDLGTPVLALRDDAGRFHAVVNACTHRGVRLVEAARGTGRRFMCPFHQWTFDNAGALVGLPKAEHFGDVDRACLGLRPLPAVEHAGLLWVHPDPDGEINAEACLGAALAEDLAAWSLDGLVHMAEDAYDVRCNWKLAMDTFGETYHFEALHKDTLAASFRGNVQCYDTFGRHHRMLLCRREIDDFPSRPEDSWHILHATLPVYWLFPNVILMPHADGCYLVRAYPDPADPGRHTSRITFYGTRPVAEWAAAGNVSAASDMARGFADIIRDEDYAMSASQQRSAASGALSHVLFGRNEPALHHYHNTYREALGLPPLPLIDPASLSLASRAGTLEGSA